MKVSLVICTWNRARLLDQTLTGLRVLQIPDGVAWEVLVVNNNCTDNTDEVIARHQNSLPVRRLFEPKGGKSHAANLAVSQVTGDLIVWTDDDVLVQADWVAQYLRAARDWPDAVCFAGIIDPWFEKEPPSWIRRHIDRLKGAYVIVNYGDTERPLKPSDGVFGANMAFRTSIAREFPFNVRLGRNQGSLLGGEDVEIVQRMMRSGYHGVWVPSARINHFISSERLTKHYIWKWYHGSGLTFVRQGGLSDCQYLWDAPRWVIKQYCLETLKAWFYSPFKGPRWFQSFIEAARYRGVIEEARAARREARTHARNDVLPVESTPQPHTQPGTTEEG